MKNPPTGFTHHSRISVCCRIKPAQSENSGVSVCTRSTQLPPGPCYLLNGAPQKYGNPSVSKQTLLLFPGLLGEKPRPQP